MPDKTIKNAGYAFRHGFNRGYQGGGLPRPTAPQPTGIRGAARTASSLGATPLLAANAVRTAGGDNDMMAYMQLAQLQGWPMPATDPKTNQLINMPTPMQKKNAKRQLTNRELLWMGLNLLQDATVKSVAGPYAPAVNGAIDAAVMGSDLRNTIDKGIGKFYDPKFKEENVTGREPGVADLFGFIAKHMTQPGELQGWMNMIGNQPLPKYLQHPNRMGMIPVTTAADLMQVLAMPFGNAITGASKTGGRMTKAIVPDPGEKTVPFGRIAKNVGREINADISDFARNNVGGAAAEISKHVPRQVKKAVRYFGSSENSFIP